MTMPKHSIKTKKEKEWDEKTWETSTSYGLSASYNFEDELIMDIQSIQRANSAKSIPIFTHPVTLEQTNSVAIRPKKKSNHTYLSLSIVMTILNIFIGK